MKRIFSFLAAALICATVYAGNQQAGSTFFPLTNPKTYARGDGLYLMRSNNIPVLIGNGDGFDQIGPQMYDLFEYGDGDGCNAQFAQQYTYSAAAANTSCVTTCAAAVPAGTCIIGFDGVEYAACATATNDVCLCYNAGDAEECGAALPTTAGYDALLTFGHGMKLGYHAIVAQTIAPDMDADGLDVGCDQTDNDGIELIAGGVLGSSGRPFVVGEDPAFQFCVTSMIEDVSGTDDFHIGFRRPETFNDTFDNYDDLASIGNISGNIYIETIDGGAATVSTDTTDDWADLATKELCVLVSDAGVVTYTIDGQAPTTTAAVTLTDGEAYVPFLHYLQASDLTGEIILSKWEVKFQ